MVEQLRSLVVSVEMDTNKRTERKRFNLSDYESVEYMIETLKNYVLGFVNSID